WIGRDMPYRLPSGSTMGHLAATFPDVWGRRVRPVGALSRDETARRQAAARFVLVPSVWDTFNLTCAEAMGFGKVVLWWEGAGAPELIENGVSGLTFRPRDPEALRAAIDGYQSLGTPARRAMGEGARERVRCLLDPDAVTDRRLETYQALQKEGKW